MGDFVRVSCFSIGFHLFVISINYFLIFEAKTFKDYFESFLFGFSAFNLNIQHLVLIWQRKNVLEMMDDLQDIVNEREYWNRKFKIQRISSIDFNRSSKSNVEDYL